MRRRAYHETIERLATHWGDPETLGVGTALVRRLVMEQPRPFNVDAGEAALGSQ
jgi:hypothetical protein